VSTPKGQRHLSEGLFVTSLGGDNHAICEYIKNGHIELICTSTNDMLTDGLTKLHVHMQLSNFITGLGLT